MLSLWRKVCFGVIQVNMSRISGVNTNVTFQIQVHVRLTGKCLLRYIEVVLHYMETNLHTLFSTRANVNVSLFLPYITCYRTQVWDNLNGNVRIAMRIWKCSNFDENFAEVCIYGNNWQQMGPWCKMDSRIHQSANAKRFSCEIGEWFLAFCVGYVTCLQRFFNSLRSSDT